MKFSIIHPTARVTPAFEHPWWIAAESALLGCDSPQDVEYILNVHHSRAAAFYAMLAGPVPSTEKLWGVAGIRCAPSRVLQELPVRWSESRTEWHTIDSHYRGRGATSRERIHIPR